MKHIVGFSGGIDSQACARWVLNRFPSSDVILLKSDAGGNEHPLTTSFVAEYSAKVHPVTIVSATYSDMWKTPGFAEKRGFDGAANLTFDQMAKIKGRYAHRWMAANLGDQEFMRYSGVRREESHKRKDRQFREYDDYFDCELCNPVVDWTKQMVFDYVRFHYEPINPLYSLGFERVGCAPCINNSKEDIRRWADRFPEMIEKIRRWEVEAGSTFFAPIVPGLPNGGFNSIDVVVEWARTDRGGKQFNILKSEGIERPGCESRFGLCE
jgi:3'-phosphoadenosine 5'-phosphosulfate sulfotransferase (PAPS reductase)/FAD synthetase